MLPYILALVIGLGSFAYYMAAFFFPEVHRKSDFFWSGVGFFYALVLWVCGGRITGAVLLSQIASVSLLGWLGWQTLIMRRQLALPEAQTEISPQVQKKIARSGIFQLGKSAVIQPVARVFTKKPVTPTPVATEPEPITEPVVPETEIETVTQITEQVQPPSKENDIPLASPTAVTEETPEEPVMADITESVEVMETGETTPTELVEAPAEETTQPEPIGEFAPEETPVAEISTEAQKLTETPVAETPAEEQTLTKTPVAKTAAKPGKKQPKQSQGISGFFNNLLGKRKSKPAKTKKPQTFPEDTSTLPEPEIPEFTQPDTLFQESPTPSQEIEETAAGEETQTVDTTFGEQTQPPEPELPQNQDTQPPETPEEFTIQETKLTDSEPLMGANPPEPEQVDAANQSAEPESSAVADIPVADIAPEAPLSPPAEPIGEGDPQTRQSPDSA
ncbi:Ycf66 family protein [Coleofasciculus sp. G2-EDA-02]|uniref:Ycf66 family protein n=1 Tax=Coleofasciculus sp. G2-EDA-02 TaxID=3069529 RepID=UPI0032FFFD66